MQSSLSSSFPASSSGMSSSASSLQSSVVAAAASDCLPTPSTLSSWMLCSSSPSSLASFANSSPFSPEPPLPAASCCSVLVTDEDDAGLPPLLALPPSSIFFGASLPLDSLSFLFFGAVSSRISSNSSLIVEIVNCFAFRSMSSRLGLDLQFFMCTTESR
uniref:Putative secreted protein n=1 Tax=Anopheles marajoara TaxID=58244 RepID=A0A2M4C6N7_9DIPT